jgi:hypothetical protein
MASDIAVVLSVFGFTLTLAAAAWVMRGNYRLVTSNIELVAKLQVLQGATAEAREAFYRYATIHRVKGTPEGDKKARVNQDLGDAMNARSSRAAIRNSARSSRRFVNMSRKIERESGRVHG